MLKVCNLRLLVEYQEGKLKQAGHGQIWGHTSFSPSPWVLLCAQHCIHSRKEQSLPVPLTSGVTGLQSPWCLAEKSPSSGNDHAQRFLGEWIPWNFPKEKKVRLCARAGSTQPASIPAEPWGSRQGHSAASLHLPRALGQEGHWVFVTGCARGLIQTFREKNLNYKYALPFYLGRSSNTLLLTKEKNT